MTLTEHCLLLPYRDRVSLCAALQESILEDRGRKSPRSRNRGKILLDMMAEVIGEDVDLSSRLSKFVWARTMVAYQLTQEGYSTLEAGKMLGKNHSTIVYMRHNMANALTYPAMYGDVIDIWKQFLKRLQNETDRRTNQDPL